MKSIKGLKIITGDYWKIAIIEQLHKEFLSLISRDFVSICLGKIPAQEDPDFHTYSDSLKSFFDGYDKKTPEQKMGTIGELLTHILLRALYDQCHVGSIMFNKEEKSARKGFDVLVVWEKKLWFTEVKSGNAENNTADKKSQLLLDAAALDIKKRLSDTTTVAWRNALIDIMLTTEVDSQKALKNILKESAKRKDPKSENVLLSSVVYSAKDSLTDTWIKGHMASIQKRHSFGGVFLFVMQKDQYAKIAEFLRQELVQNV